MTDGLDAAIRARLEERPCFATHELHGDRARDANGWISHAKAAIAAALDLHKPRTAVEGPLEGKPICDECSDGTNEWLATADPCPTKRDIATELGIQVNDG